jgi:hypothetical protein
VYEIKYALTSERLCGCQTRSGVRTHKAIKLIVILPNLIQQTDGNSTLPKIAMDNQLSDPTHSFTIIGPSTGKHITGKTIFNGNSSVRADSTLG